MGAWTGWLIPIAAFLLLGIAASFYIYRVRLPRQEAAAGIAALAALRWRDFIGLVLDALQERGYRRAPEPDAPAVEGDYLLEFNGQRWLLSSKRGASYVLGSTAIAEFANTIRTMGASGGLLVTSGQFAPEARPVAAAQRIELLDGPKLWPQLRPLLQEARRLEIAAPARARARSQALLAWLGALAVGVLLAVATAGLDEGSPAPEAVDTPAPNPVPAPQRQPAAPASVDGIPLPAPTDPATLERRRNDAASAISTLPGVSRALWSTQSTLLVILDDETADPMSGLCPLLERYDELAASRIQLQPPPGSTRMVRFLQCRAY